MKYYQILPRQFSSLASIEVQEIDHDDDDDVSSSPEVPVARKACASRSCAPRTEELEATLERRVVAQTARHRARLKLVRLRGCSMGAIFCCGVQVTALLGYIVLYDEVMHSRATLQSSVSVATCNCCVIGIVLHANQKCVVWRARPQCAECGTTSSVRRCTFQE